MSDYFSYFPIINYSNVNVVNIMRRNSFVTNTLANPNVFLPYTVKDGERPEDIAYHYYGSVDATWLVTLANNITDPLTQWPVDHELLEKRIASKYATQSGLSGWEVVAWSQDESITDNILYYYTTTLNGDIIKLSTESFNVTFDGLDSRSFHRDDGASWSPYRVYDYERDLNENRREIVVVEKKYYEQIRKEFEQLMAS